MADFRTVIIELIGKTDKLQKDFKKVEQRTNKLTAGFKRMGLALVGVFGSRALFHGFQQTLKSTDQLIKTAKGVGFATSEYQRLIFALDQVGVSAGSAKIALGDFQKRLSKAVAGTSPQFAKAFKDAGLDIKSLSKMSPAEAFNVALAHLATLRNDPRIAGLTGNVFEEQSGKDVLQVLRQWTPYLEAFETHGRRVATLSADQESSIEALNEELKVYAAQWEGIKMNVVADTAPTLLGILTAMEEADTFGKMADGMSESVDEILKVIDNVKWLKSEFDKLDQVIPDWAKTLLEGGLGPRVGDFATAPFDFVERIRSFAAPRREIPKGSGALHKRP